ncbi:tetratricopeptide repeat protein [Dolichospermum sp. UHCC 0684]|jgi:tetratricopeptide (TPR) repeat protein|uniref:tetratricopeptide repeat protein n=1 Tax=unclassified Dolichospermum TaxID=2622029 RepID=UPI001446005E|nr:MULTISPECIES: tetratricopeptide repeat protein [unclassified Dolichospermum]MEA5528429.1 tetratricopeptide repeat protein [Dolichospermum sp. UHCC 0684]MTJ36043.1 tetratricopeptide repeat protein [Dolichospermum sp. UHCC 0260]
MIKVAAIRQQLNDQDRIALAYDKLGRIYQGCGKYEEAISYHEQSRELYQQLGKEKDVADSWYWIADCYREWGKYQQAVDCENQDLAIRLQLNDQDRIALAYDQLGKIYQGWGKYEQAISYHEQSRELYQRLGRDENVARCFRRLANCQILLAKNTVHTIEATELMKQAEKNIHQAIEINTLGQYQENLNRSEEMAQGCLEIFQDYNRQKLTASVYKLLGEIYLKRTQQNQPDNQVIAHQFLTQSLQIYQDLDLQKQAGEISMILGNV